jgi:biotin carboxyl carrier protein
MGKKFKVKVDESFEYNLKNSDTEKLDILQLSNSKFHIINNNKSFNIELENSDFNNKQYVIKVNANSYNVKISNELDQLIKEMGFSTGSVKKTNNIKAPMPGLILSIHVENGQEVAEGDTLLILEAMKMENAISAPRDGIIKTVIVKNGGSVEKGELMIEMA